MAEIAIFLRSLLETVFGSLRRNFVLVILSAALAFTLWIFVSDTENSVRSGLLPLDIPIQAVNVPADVAVAGVTPGYVQLRVEVEKDVWDTLAVEDFEATVDVLNFPEGSHQLTVEVVPLRSPGNLRITEVNPEPVEVVLTALFSKSVPVIVDTIGDPSPGYALSKPRPDSSDVVVSGPQNLVDLVESVSATVDISGSASSVNRAFRLLARDGRDQRVEGVLVEPSVMNVLVPIQVAVSELLINPTVEGTPANGFNVTGFSTLPVVITIIPNEITPDDLRIVSTKPVSITNARSDVTQTVSLDLPLGITVIGVDKVQVTVHIEPALGQLPFLVELNEQGREEGLEVHGLPSTVEVVLSGELPSLRTVQPREINVTVDLDGLSAGTHTVVVQVDGPSTFTVVSVTPSDLTVLLVEEDSPTDVPEDD